MNEYEIEFEFDDGVGTGDAVRTVYANSVEEAIFKLETEYEYGKITSFEVIN